MLKGTCSKGTYDEMSSRCVEKLRYSSLTKNKVLTLEYQCKAETLLDLTLSSCRFVYFQIYFDNIC